MSEKLRIRVRNVWDAGKNRNITVVHDPTGTFPPKTDAEAIRLARGVEGDTLVVTLSPEGINPLTGKKEGYSVYGRG